MHVVLLVIVLLGVVVKERKKRQLAEQRIEVLEKTSMKLIQHYDSRFIELAKEVSDYVESAAEQSYGPVAAYLWCVTTNMQA